MCDLSLWLAVRDLAKRSKRLKKPVRQVKSAARIGGDSLQGNGPYCVIEAYRAGCLRWVQAESLWFMLDVLQGRALFIFCPHDAYSSGYFNFTQGGATIASWQGLSGLDRDEYGNT